MLAIENLSKKIDHVEILKNINFSINQGEIKALLGPNGAGKTTLFSIIMGLMSPSGGILTIDDTLITNLSISERIFKGLCYLPQDSSLFLQLSVFKNIECVLELRGMSHAKDRRNFINPILEMLNIQSIAQKKTLVLSGGQRRRVEFARLLACNPRFVLLDEPFAGVDPLSIEDIQEQIHLLKAHNIGVLISDHNVDATLAIATSAYILINGQIVASGGKDLIYANKLVQESYLGS
jgi:lipopolysaccharide export system ATP-binding protein